MSHRHAALWFVAALGVVLVLARPLWAPTPDEPPIPASLDWDVRHRDLGAVARGRETAVVFPWRVSGAGDVRVLRLTTTCACAAVDGLPRSLRAGEDGHLRVRLQPRQEGPFRERIRVITSAPPGKDVHDLILRGHVGLPLRLVPGILDLGRSRPGQVLRGVATLEADVDLDPAWADWRWEGLAEALAARMAVEPGLDPKRYRAVHIRARAPAVPGPWTRVLRLRHPRWGELRLVLRGNAIAPDSTGPPRGRENAPRERSGPR